MLQGKEAIIFDLDGTLVDSMGIWREIDEEYLGKRGISLPHNLQAEIEGMSFSETAHYFKKRFSLPEAVEQIQADWNAMAVIHYQTTVALKPGVRQFLEDCHQAGMKLGIATSNSRLLVEEILRVQGIDQYFSVIKTSCEAQKGKPAPDIYLLVAKELNVPVQNCLVFEDIVAGIQAGLAAGMQVCAVEDAYSHFQREEKKNLSHYYIMHYDEIKRLHPATMAAPVSEDVI